MCVACVHALFCTQLCYSGEGDGGVGVGGEGGNTHEPPYVILEQEVDAKGNKKSKEKKGSIRGSKRKLREEKKEGEKNSKTAGGKGLQEGAEGPVGAEVCKACGVMWRGVVWRGVVWCGVVWCGVVWCGVSTGCLRVLHCCVRGLSGVVAVKSSLGLVYITARLYLLIRTPPYVCVHVCVRVCVCVYVCM